MTLGPVLCIASTAICFLCFSSQRSLGGDTTRSITSMTVAERMNLPDSTMVQLPSNRVVSLGTLRSEHRAREMRFSMAAALGHSVAAKWAVHPTGPGQLSPPPANVRSAPGQTTKGGGGLTKATTTNIGVSPAVAAPLLVPFHPIAGIPLAKDYSDFCTAAKASVCVYVPPNTFLRNSGAGLETQVMMDLDPLIIDDKTCLYDGGVPSTGIPSAGCKFYYPFKSLANFLPTGPLTTNAVCDPPGQYVVDPKGAVQANFTYPGLPFTTGAKPITCAVQVWIGK
jgi:hypothetical protein